MTAGGVALSGGAQANGASFGQAERTLLLLIALGLWVATFVNLNVSWFTPPIDHQSERAMRLIVTCTAGAVLCLAMLPVLARTSLEPLGKQLWIAAGVSFAAYLAHLVIRLVVFHLYRPLWGPLTLEVVRDALPGPGWMFALWSAVCLLVMGEARRRRDASSGGGADPLPRATPEAIWCVTGGRRVRVDLADVVLLAAERDYVRVHARKQQYLVRGRLKEWAKALPADEFMQVHRSAIVRLSAITGIERAGSVWRIRLPDGTDTLVSRHKGKDVRQWLTASSAMRCRLR